MVYLQEWLEGHRHFQGQSRTLFSPLGMSVIIFWQLEIRGVINTDDIEISRCMIAKTFYMLMLREPTDSPTNVVSGVSGQMR